MAVQRRIQIVSSRFMWNFPCFVRSAETTDMAARYGFQSARGAGPELKSCCSPWPPAHDLRATPVGLAPVLTSRAGVRSWAHALQRNSSSGLPGICGMRAGWHSGCIGYNVDSVNGWLHSADLL